MTRIGLVLGAGGFAGLAFHAGVLGALAESTGWDARTADVIVGTSAGSRVGALLRSGFEARDFAAYEMGQRLSPTGQRLIERMGRVPHFDPPRATALLRGPRLPSAAVLRRFLRHPWDHAGALATSFLPDGPVSSAGFADALRSITGTDWPTDPLWICACRARDGERVVFGRDSDAPAVDVPTAVAASCAIPGYFAPVAVDGSRFVDGGVRSPTNLDVLAGEPLDLAIVVSPMSVARRSFGSPDVMIRRMFRLRLAQEARRVRAAGTPVVAFQPGSAEVRALGVNAMDPNRSRWRRAVISVREATLRRLERDDLSERLGMLTA